MKLTDPAKDIQPVLNPDGSVDEAKTAEARRAARRATKGWSREPTHIAQEARREERVATAFEAMGGGG